MSFIHKKCRKYYLGPKINQMIKNLIIRPNIYNQIKKAIRQFNFHMLNVSSNSILRSKKKKIVKVLINFNMQMIKQSKNYKIIKLQLQLST